MLAGTDARRHRARPTSVTSSRRSWTAPGYRAELAASSDPQDGARLDNLNELVSVAREFSSDARNAARPAMDETAAEESARSTPGDGEPDPGSLAAFLERVSLVADSDQIPDNDEGVVTLMTLHTAKGLEFPVVFVTGWEDGQFPHMRALGDPAELSEERRLAYVGITRARHRLYLTRAVMRSAWGQPITESGIAVPAGDPVGSACTGVVRIRAPVSVPVARSEVAVRVGSGYGGRRLRRRVRRRLRRRVGTHAELRRRPGPQQPPGARGRRPCQPRQVRARQGARDEGRRTDRDGHHRLRHARARSG